MQIVATILFMEWLLLVVALLVVQHLLVQATELLVLAVAVVVLIPIPQEQQVLAA
jgi:hypothetical protein